MRPCVASTASSLPLRDQLGRSVRDVDLRHCTDDRGGYNGHDEVIPIIARLKARGRPTRYLTAEEGPDQPGLQRPVDNHDIADLVTFLGYVANYALPDLYRATSAYSFANQRSEKKLSGICYLRKNDPAQELTVNKLHHFSARAYF
jgi:glycosyltransferase involved in cell wall biosynthesis